MLLRRRLLLSSSSQTPRRDPFDMVDKGEWTELYDYLTPTLNHHHHEYLDTDTTTTRRRITTRREATKVLQKQQKAATMEIKQLQKTLSKRKYVPEVGTKLHFLSYVLWKKKTTKTKTNTNTSGRNGSGSGAAAGPVPKRVIQQILTIDSETIKVTDTKGRLPLHIACMNPYTSLDVIEFLLERYGRASRIGDKEYGNVPLFYAILSACEEDDNDDSDCCENDSNDDHDEKKHVRFSTPTSLTTGSSSRSHVSSSCDDVISDSRLQVIASLLAISPQTIRHINNKYETPVDIVSSTTTTTTTRLDRKQHNRHYNNQRSRAVQALINGVSDAYMDGSLLDEFSKEFTTLTTTATTRTGLQHDMAPSGEGSTVVADVGGGAGSIRGRRCSYNHIDVGGAGSDYGILNESESRGAASTARRKSYSSGDRIGFGGGGGALINHEEKNSSTCISLSSSSALFSDLDIVESREFQLRDNATPMPTMGTGSMLKYVLRIKK